MANYNKSPRIVGGSDLRPHEFPWLALILYNGTYTCAGSVVSDLYVLTATHCLPSGFERERLKVKLAEHDTCKQDGVTTVFSVGKIVKHPLYNKEDFTADLTLLRLSMRITFGKYVRPICLPKYSEFNVKFLFFWFALARFVISGVNGRGDSRYGGRSALVIGWGKLRYGAENLPCTPKKLPVPILDRQKCNENVSWSLFCAGYLDGRGDSCQGDSGGPLQVKNSERYELVGVVSNGIGCALPGIPGLYTDVLAFVPWITRHISDSYYCI